MDERAAVERLKRGDVGGLEALVDRYHTRATRAAYLVVCDRALAEDVAQGAFVRAGLLRDENLQPTSRRLYPSVH